MASVSNRAVNRLEAPLMVVSLPERVHAAFAPRRLRMQDRLILACAQVSPLTFRWMVVELAGGWAFRARPIHHLVVRQMYVDFTHLQLQLDRVHVPGCFDTE